MNQPQKHSPAKALNKAFRKVKPDRNSIELFKTNLIQLLDRMDENESEEFHKNAVSEFLSATYYAQDHYINTKDRKDLVIYNGKNNKSTPGVILETKKPGNKPEMPKEGNLNCKALQELLLYFMRERITNRNLDLKNLVVTDVYEWYIFDAQLFERLFAENKSLVKRFEDFEQKDLSGIKTEFFYKEIAAPIIEEVPEELEHTYFDIRKYEKPLRNEDKKDDVKLVALYKLLSAEHMLKKPFTNDSNSLDKQFYSELLHIIGLKEVKKGNKKLIERRPEKERLPGSLMENTYTRLEMYDKIDRVENPKEYGNNRKEQLFNISLQLTLTWVNRILFLKLLEAQLLNYHKGDEEQAFLNNKKVRNLDDLDALFFQVLAKKYDERNERARERFGRVPYLNSSLFEPTDLENQCITIANLDAEEVLPLHRSSVLTDKKGKRKKGEMNTLEYLFAFLGSYDFSSEGSGEIQEENKTLINASVLGLIFEKINGYKDGSFFTPGFITMYMCRQTIERAAVQKCNERLGFNSSTFADLREDASDFIRRHTDGRAVARKQLNEAINDIKICDPAVGSGHFLVSALNELIAVKHRLHILQDVNGEALREYKVEVINDELIVTHTLYDDEPEFTYNPQNAESRRVQQALFHEKQTIIENCLFGVDINPNSVKICRLRLWIELLKSAYYKGDVYGQNQELETLPNIDINIKCGNSLISRFDLDADLSKALKNGKKWKDITAYKLAVQQYRESQGRDKKKIKQLIAEIKADFRSNIDDPFKSKLSKARGKVDKISTEINTKKQWEEKVSKKLFKDLDAAVQKLKKLEKQRDEIQANKIYENAFEWRFEFPEVLDNNGNFIGFDAVIGNPPYINAIELKKMISPNEYQYYKSNFKTAKGTVDLYVYFFEKGYSILANDGYLNFITPNRYLSASYGKALREFVLKNSSLKIIGDYSNVKVFKEASTYPITTLFQKTKNQHSLYTFTFIDETSEIVYRNHKDSNLSSLENYVLGFVLSEKYDIVKKVIKQSDKIKNCGIINATSTAKEADEFNKHINSKSGFKLINTGTIDKYCNKWGAQELKDKRCEYLKPFLPKDEKILGLNRYRLYSRPKIIFAKIAITPEAFYDANGAYASVNTNCIHSFNDEYNPFYVLAWVNSKLFQYMFECFYDGLKMSGGYLPYTAPNLSNMYIKSISKEEQEKIAQKAEEIQTIKESNLTNDTSGLERAIDKEIYKLYDLSRDEVEIVEGV